MKTHRLVIPNWHPAKLNELLRNRWKSASLKKADREMVSVYRWQQNTARATGKRRVTLRITLGPKQRAGDPDAYWKSLLDALTACGLLIDDNRQHVETAPVLFDRGQQPSTEIILEDIEAQVAK